MKKRPVILLTACMIMTVTVFPQKKFEGGLTIGTGIADFRGLDAEYLREDISYVLSEALGEEFPVESRPRTFTLNGGVFGIYNVLPWLGIRVAADYVQKGQGFRGDLYLTTNLNMESQVLEFSSGFRLDYLELPVSVQLSNRSKRKEKNVYFYVNAGVAPAFNISAKNETTMSLVERGFNNSGVTSDVIESESEVNDLDGIASNDLGVLVSAGIVFNSIALDVKLTNGRKSIYEDPDDGDIRNNNISFSMWFIF